MAREYLISKYEENERNRSWNAIFQSIENRSDKQERLLNLSTRTAHMWQNVEKNRYRNVSTYDSSRIKLQKTSDDQSDYINASPLSVPQAKRNYVLTQGPLSSTCNDFWQMVWEQESTLIVMLNRVIEKNSAKCHAYFPTEECKERIFDTFRINLKSEEKFEHFIVRTVELHATDARMKEGSSNDEPRTILHFQFISWPDFGVPHCSRVFLEFLGRVRATGRLEQPAPVIVHCSAGIGRSGTFVVVDSVLSMIDEKVPSVDIEELVVKMRKSRMGLIQTPQQLQFCWKSIADALRSTETEAKSSNSSNDAPKVVDARPTGIVGSGRGDGPHLERSAANQMTSGQHAKSLTDLSSIRKRSSGEAFETDEDAKYARRDSGENGLKKCEHDSVKANGRGRRTLVFHSPDVHSDVHVLPLPPQSPSTISTGSPLE